MVLDKFPLTKIPFTLLIVIILLPLFFINARSSHDWGGDFAMYIMQAKNIVSGISQTETLYLYNPENPVFGPPAYYIGFPIILSPVYAVFGNSISMMSLWVSFFLFASGVVMSIFFRQYFSKLISFFLVIIIIYNPRTLGLKLEIMSEFPFLFLLLLLLLLYDKYSKRYLSGILFAIMGGFLISIRMIGIAFPIAVLIFTVWKWIAENNKICGHKCINGIITSFGSVLIFLLLNNIIFAIPQTESGSYIDIWAGEKPIDSLLINMAYYVEQFKLFFSPWSGDWNFLPNILNAFVFTFTLLGMIKVFTERLKLVDIFVIIYLGIILLYPFHHTGVRFLFPIIPFLLVYLVRGLELINLFPNVGKTAKTIVLSGLMLASYLNMFLYILDTDDRTLKGPQTNASIEAFNNIKEVTNKDAVFLFAKPRVLALYSERHCLGDDFDANDKEISEMITKFEVNYILVHNEKSGDALKDFVINQKDVIAHIWSNKEFDLYEVKLD